MKRAVHPAKPKTDVTAVLDAMQHADQLLSSVEDLVRQSRRMLAAFQSGDPSLFTSASMERALAPFEGWNPVLQTRGW